MNRKSAIKLMKSVLLLISLLLTPIVIVFGSSFGSVSHPAKGNLVDPEILHIDDESDTAIIFFGYVGCSYICPTSLYKIDEMLSEQNDSSKFEGLSVLFADIANRPGVVSSDRYAKNISSRMQGINLLNEQLDYAVDMFNLRIRDTKRMDSEVYHTDHFFVLKRRDKTFEIIAVLPNQVTTEKLAEVLFQ